MVKLISLGCGDAFSSLGNMQSCHLLKLEKENILLDCGSTVLLAMKKFKVSLDSIDRIFISHFHGDHFGGLAFLLLKASYVDQRLNPLEIIGPLGLKNKIKSLLKLFYPGNPENIIDKPFLKITEIESNDYSFYDWGKVQFIPVNHGELVNAHGLKMNLDQTSLFYTGDTGDFNGLEDLFSSSSYVISECNFDSLKIEGHLNKSQLNTFNLTNRVKKVFITHSAESFEMTNSKFESLVEGKTYILD